MSKPNIVQRWVEDLKVGDVIRVQVKDRYIPRNLTGWYEVTGIRPVEATMVDGHNFELLLTLVRGDRDMDDQMSMQMHAEEVVMVDRGLS